MGKNEIPQLDEEPAYTTKFFGVSITCVKVTLLGERKRKESANQSKSNCKDENK